MKSAPIVQVEHFKCTHFAFNKSSFSSGAGGQPLRGQTLNCCFHLQLSNLFSWSLVHRPEDQAVSRLFVHGGKPDLLNDLKNFDFAQVHLLHLLVCLWWNTALPATLTWQVHYPFYHSKVDFVIFQVGDKPRVCGADVRDGRVLVHENRVADNPCEHGGRSDRPAAQNRPPLMWDLIMLQ